MLCKFSSRKGISVVMIILGAAFLISGVLLRKELAMEQHSLQMLAGFLTGLGGAFFGIGSLNLIRFKIKSAEELRSEEIEQKDERNIFIQRIAYSIVAISSVIMFAVISMILLLLDFILPAIIVMSALMLNLTLYLVTYSVLKKKM
ncbi:MAG: hypothetical protein GX988_05525 [Clostridiales bacterium]|nr:hypothetical protein [Clostridiales bacterium]